MAFWLKIFSDARKKQHATPNSSCENLTAHVCLMMLPSCPVCRGRPSSAALPLELRCLVGLQFETEAAANGC